MKGTILGLVTVLALGFSIACTQNANNVSSNSDQSYKDSVKQALQQADLGDVTVDEDRDKNTITLGGKVHSEDAKQRAADVARQAAGQRIIANEVSVQPVGMESDAKKIESNVDDGIENNYKAALISNGLDKQSIHYDAKNAVLKLSGSVRTMAQRKQAQEVGASVPNVVQVVNEIKVKR